MVYMDELIKELQSTSIGCYVGHEYTLTITFKVMQARCEFESIWKIYDYSIIAKSFYTNCAQSVRSSSQK